MSASRRFSGRTYNAGRDRERLTKQYDHVFAVMRDGRPRTLSDIRKELYRRFDILAPMQSISARLRDMRKTRFGGHIVERDYIEKGLFQYQLLTRKRRGRR